MSRSLRILHTSDLHLDAGLRTTGLPSPRARERCQAHLDAFDWIVAAVPRLGIDVLCIAGDLFEAAQTRPATVRHVAHELGACGRPVFIAPGNHDPMQERSVYRLARWPENVTVFGGAWQSVRLPDLGLVVHGRGFTEPVESARLLAGLVVEGDGPHLLVAHGSDESCRPDRHHPYRPFVPAELDSLPLTYAALGHYHRFSRLPTQRVSAAYSGCPIPQNFADVEQHGVVLATLRADGVDIELLPVPGRRFVTLELDVSGADTQADLVRRLQTELEQRALQEDFVRLHVRGSIAPDLELEPVALREALAPHVHDLTLRDETVPEYDLATLALENTVRGQFVRTLQARLQDAADADAEIVRRALVLGLDALAGRSQSR
ncbi:MAG TPA: exonuclease SbcCD subunit D [Candidatus Krumholzibacteria bacterium]|nr:exonuclease SbcCD subunit D [Candidatus Krumholzibacteria bacterium]